MARSLIGAKAVRDLGGRVVLLRDQGRVQVVEGPAEVLTAPVKGLADGWEEKVSEALRQARPCPLPCPPDCGPPHRRWRPRSRTRGVNERPCPTIDRRCDRPSRRHAHGLHRSRDQCRLADNKLAMAPRKFLGDALRGKCHDRGKMERDVGCGAEGFKLPGGGIFFGDQVPRPVKGRPPVG